MTTTAYNWTRHHAERFAQLAQDDRDARVRLDARQLSSGTIATLTGVTSYDEVDAIRAEFVAFVYAAPRVGAWDTWQDAWSDFKQRGTP